MIEAVCSSRSYWNMNFRTVGVWSARTPVLHSKAKALSL